MLREKACALRCDRNCKVWYPHTSWQLYLLIIGSVVGHLAPFWLPHPWLMRIDRSLPSAYVPNLRLDGGCYQSFSPRKGKPSSGSNLTWLFCYHRKVSLIDENWKRTLYPSYLSFVIFLCYCWSIYLRNNVVEWLMSSTWRHTLSQTFVFGQGLFQTISRYLLELPQQQKALQIGEGSFNDSPSPLSHFILWQVRGAIFPSFSLLIQGVQNNSRKEKVASKDVASSKILQDLEVGNWMNLSEFGVNLRI